WLEARLGHRLTTFSSTRRDPGMMDYPWDDWWSRNSGVMGEEFRRAVDAGEMPLYYRVGEKGKVSFVEGLKATEFDIAGGIARPRTYIVGVDPTNIRDVSEAHIKSAQYLFKLVAFLNKYIPGFEKAQIIRLADTTLNRAGRAIENEAAPTSEEI